MGDLICGAGGEGVILMYRLTDAKSPKYRLYNPPLDLEGQEMTSRRQDFAQSSSPFKLSRIRSPLIEHCLTKTCMTSSLRGKNKSPNPGTPPGKGEVTGLFSGENSPLLFSHWLQATSGPKIAFICYMRPILPCGCLRLWTYLSGGLLSVTRAWYAPGTTNTLFRQSR